MSFASKVVGVSVVVVAIFVAILSVTAMHIPTPSTAHSDWKVLDRAPSTAATSFTWLFPARGSDWLKQQLDDRSDPKSPNYGHWLTKEEIDAKTSADPALVAPVIEWLHNNGIADSQIERRSGDLVVSCTVADVEKLFRTKLHECRRINEQTGEVDANSAPIYRSPHGAEVPDALQSSLDLLIGVVDLPMKLHHGPIRRGPIRHPHPIPITDPNSTTGHSSSDADSQRTAGTSTA